MRNTRYLSRLFALALSLLLLLGALPALAADAGAPATREYTIAAFAEAAGLDGAAAALDGFADARSVDAQYAAGIGKAVAAGVVRGYEDGTLRPKETVTRAEAMVLLSRCLPELEAVWDAAAFSDVPAWAKADVDRLSAAGLVAGYGGGVLGANDALTVDQVDMLVSRAVGKSLLGAVVAANSPSRLFLRQASYCRHEDIYSRGKLFFSDDLYADAERVYYDFGDRYIHYLTPDSSVFSWKDDEATVILAPPEEYAESLRIYQTYLAVSDGEFPDAVEERGDELLFTTRITDADAFRALQELKRAVFGEGYETDYEAGTEFRFEYLIDAESLVLKELTETLCLPDGSELPSLKTVYAYGVELPDPTAPDCILSPAFDKTAEQKRITLVFAPGTPEEQTCRYTMPKDLPFSIYYHDSSALDMCEDAAFTQPFTGTDGRPECTIYVREAAK